MGLRITQLVRHATAPIDIYTADPLFSSNILLFKAQKDKEPQNCSFPNREVLQNKTDTSRQKDHILRRADRTARAEARNRQIGLQRNPLESQ